MLFKIVYMMIEHPEDSGWGYFTRKYKITEPKNGTDTD